MAIDTKKIVKEAANFKKGVADAAKNIKEIKDIYAEQTKIYGNYKKQVEGLLTTIAEGKTRMANDIALLKHWADEAKTIESDVEMALRREAENSESLSDMYEQYENAAKALKADKTNRQLATKAELAEKALAKQTIVHARISNDAVKAMSAIYLLHDTMETAKAEAKTRAESIGDAVKELVKIALKTTHK
ncbi:MAG: hypothetical protein H7245_04255 [Candidatus Saccharibacteria bacterium]|nr:hypothetical protein [Pseudorhodobacter sp.]